MGGVPDGWVCSFLQGCSEALGSTDALFKLPVVHHHARSPPCLLCVAAYKMVHLLFFFCADC